MPVFWWRRLHLVFLVGRSTSGSVFCGVCGFIMILGNVSANGWGCVPVLLVVWHMVSRTGAFVLYYYYFFDIVEFSQEHNCSRAQFKYVFP